MEKCMWCLWRSSIPFWHIVQDCELFLKKLNNKLCQSPRTSIKSHSILAILMLLKLVLRLTNEQSHNTQYNFWWRLDIFCLSIRSHCDRIIVGFITYTFDAYHHWSCEHTSQTWRCVMDTSNKVCRWLSEGRWCSTMCFSTIRTAILLKDVRNIHYFII